MDSFIYRQQPFAAANVMPEEDHGHQTLLGSVIQNQDIVDPLNAFGSTNTNLSNVNGLHHSSRSGENNSSYRNRMNGSIFGTFEDPLLQQARMAAATLAEIDAKNVTIPSSAVFRPSNVFSGSVGGVGMPMIYPSCSHNSMDFDPMNISTGGSGVHMLMDGAHQSAAESMVSLQLAMQHQHPYTGYATWPPGNSSMIPCTSALNIQQQAQQHVGGSISSTMSLFSERSHVFPLISGAMTSAAQSRYHHHSTGHIGISTEHVEVNQRDLETFAEHFKQRRIKLGVTQADVGKALAHLKMPGVQTLSQSTICRFESLTLSQNNMVALKPVLENWLEKAEEVAKHKGSDLHGYILPSMEKKRKRTSIAAPEKRFLEESFKQQTRPTSERISAIATNLDLKKNVVRVWFCNQRQKQKRSQFRNRTQNIVCPSRCGGERHEQQLANVGGNGGTEAFNAAVAAATAVAAAIKQQQNCIPPEAAQGVETKEFSRCVGIGMKEENVKVHIEPQENM